MRWRKLKVSRSQRLTYYVAAAVALATFAVYLSTLQHDFVNWDDDVYVFQNPYIRSLNAVFFQWAFFDFYASNWHPLTWISHGLDYAFWGLNPMGHHLTNNLLHAINTFIVAVLTIRLVDAWKWNTTTQLKVFQEERSLLITGGVTGLLFGLHPAHVESVAWVAERKDLLCALFFLLSVMTYAKYAGFTVKETVQKNAKRRFFNRQYLLSLGSFILALLSKPMAVSLPFVLLILDWYPFKRIRSLKMFWPVFLEKLPFFTFSFMSSILTILAQRTGSAMTLNELVPLPGRMIVASRSIMEYLWKLILPLDFVPYYPYPKQIFILWPRFIVPIFLVIGITMLCIGVARKQKVWLSIWGYFVITLFPVIGIVQVGGQAMADRYSYLPSIGPFLGMGVVLAWVSGNLNSSKKWGLPIKVFSVVLALFMTVSLSYLTVRQIAIWKNSYDLWTRVIEKEPERAPVAYNNRGVYLSDTGQFDKAIADFNRAIELSPGDSTSYYCRGLAFYKMGEFDQAITDFEKTIALDPSYWEASYYRDRTLEKIGKRDQ